MLLDAGADINHKNNRNETIITSIIQMTNAAPDEHEKYIESLKLAIELGADLSVVCEENQKLSEQTNNQEVIKILKEAGIQC